MKRIKFPDGSEAIILLEDEKTGAKILNKPPNKNQMIWISIGNYEIVEEFSLDDLEKRLTETENKSEE